MEAYRLFGRETKKLKYQKDDQEISVKKNSSLFSSKHQFFFAAAFWIEFLFCVD